MKKSNMFKIEEMNLYKTTDRFLNNYKHLKKSLKREPTLEEISEIDQLHYNGIEAVNEAILKTGFLSVLGTSSVFKSRKISNPKSANFSNPSLPHIANNSLVIFRPAA